MKIQVVYEEEKGTFVIHYNGVVTHAREHELTDELIAKFKTAGFDVSEVEHWKEAPKLPDVTSHESARDRDREHE